MCLKPSYLYMFVFISDFLSKFPLSENIIDLT